MSTISKISVGGTSYDVKDAALHGLGTKLSSSNDLNSLTTPDTRYYYDGSGTAPTNSPVTRIHALVGYYVYGEDEGKAVTNAPETSAYRLAVIASPKTSSDVMQIVNADGVQMERWHLLTGGWGEWRRVNEFDGDLVSVYPPNNYGLTYIVQNNVVTIKINGYTVHNASMFASIPEEFAPSFYTGAVYGVVLAREANGSGTEKLVMLTVSPDGELSASIEGTWTITGTVTYCLTPRQAHV